MTQIRAAIQGTAGELGDAAFQGRTFQEALQLINEKAGGSASKMKEMLGTDEGLAATLALTGKNAKSAASDLGELQNSLGATEAAFEKMKDAADNQLTLLANNVQAYLRPLGEKILKKVSDIAKAFNEAFENNDIEGTISNLESLVKNAAGAFLSYKTAILLVQVAQHSYVKSSALSRLATIRHTTATTLLTGALKKQAVAMLAAGKAALANPYVLAVAGVTALGYTIFKLATQATASEKALAVHNKRVAEMKEWSDGMRSQTEEMLGVLQDENKSTLQKVEAYKKLQELYPNELKNLSLQKFLLMDMVEVNKMLSKSIDDRTMAQQRATVNSIEEEVEKNNKQIAELEKLQIGATSFASAIMIDKLRKRNEQLKIEHEKAVEIVVQGLKDRTKAEALVNNQSKQEETKFATSVDQEELKKQKKLQEKLRSELLSLCRQNQQSEIDQMKEGSDKKIAQLNLDYDRELDTIRAREKEWREAQGGKLTKEQTIEIRMAKVNAGAKLGNATSDVIHEQIEAEERAMNEYLKEYGSYLEKRQAITELYNEKIAKATTEGERLSLAEGMKKELADVDNEAQKSTSIITRLFDDMSKKNITSIRAIADEAEKFLSFLERGEYSSDNLFGITKEQFDVLRKSPDQLKAIKDEIANVRREADQMETSFNKVSNGLKKVFASESDARKLKEGLAEIEDGMSEIMQTGQFLSDMFSKLGDSFGGVFGGIAEGFSVAMDTVSSAMNGAKAGSMFGPLGASAGAAIGVVTSLAGAIAKIHDKKNEKRIQRLQDQIDTLDKSCGKLEKSIEKAYSKDASKMIEQNNKLLEQQKILIQQQIREEQNKKKTDDSRIKEWQEQIEEINDVIADNKEKAKDAIFGEDLKSAIDNFASARAEAWASGEDRAKSAKDTVKKMMRQMVTESIKAATESSGAMEKIRDKLEEFYADNVLSGWEQDYIYNMAEELQKELDRQFGWADSLIKDDKNDEKYTQESTKRGFATASQDSVDELNGRFAASYVVQVETRDILKGIEAGFLSIKDNVISIRETIGEISNISLSAIGHLETIAKNTNMLYEINDRLGSIEKNTR